MEFRPQGSAQSIRNAGLHSEWHSVHLEGLHVEDYFRTAERMSVTKAWAACSTAFFQSMPVYFLSL